jgi:serine/threonine protein kinase
MACPSRNDLAAFSRGDLPPAALEAIAEHLSACAHCLTTVESLAEDEPSGFRDFRRWLQGADPVCSAADPEYRRMEQAVLAASCAEREPQSLDNDVPAPVPTPPFALGQYQVVEKIGEGGMGSVFRAVHPRLKKEFAIKIVRAECRAANPRAAARFRREMEAIGRLDHNNIVRATDAGEADGLHYLVMELITGIDLARLVRVRGPLSVTDACELVRQVATGLQCAHEHGLVHRDVKPSNLVLSAKGEVKILDLGLALFSRNDPTAGELTMSGEAMGTPDYMAPEQWEASHAVDIRADIYSLGCALYTLLVGRAPFAAPRYSSIPRKMAAHVGELVSPVSSHRQDVPVAVERFLERMVAKEPGDRPPIPAEVAQALAPFARDADPAALAKEAMAARSRIAAPPDMSTRSDGGPRVTPSPAAVPAPSSPRPIATASRERRAVRIAAAVLVLSAIVGGVLAFWRWGGSEQRPDDKAAATNSKPPPRDGWQNLLEKPPEERLWPPELNNRRDYDRAKEVLWLNSSSHALLRLGTTNARGYRLLVGLNQPRWVGGVGVYFGGRPGESPDTFKFQSLDLRPRGPNTNQFDVVRSLGVIEPGPRATPEVASQAFASWPLGEPPNNGEQLLELEVKPGGLATVRWNGQVCTDVVGVNASKWAATHGPGDRGEFGIYCHGSSVTVTTARYLPTE